jgi:hypothetical protein
MVVGALSSCDLFGIPSTSHWTDDADPSGPPHAQTLTQIEMIGGSSPSAAYRSGSAVSTRSPHRGQQATPQPRPAGQPLLTQRPAPTSGSTQSWWARTQSAWSAGQPSQHRQRHGERGAILCHHRQRFTHVLTTVGIRRDSRRIENEVQRPHVDRGVTPSRSRNAAKYSGVCRVRDSASRRPACSTPERVNTTPRSSVNVSAETSPGCSRSRRLMKSTVHLFERDRLQCRPRPVRMPRGPPIHAPGRVR